MNKHKNRKGNGDSEAILAMICIIVVIGIIVWCGIKLESNGRQEIIERAEKAKAGEYVVNPETKKSEFKFYSEMGNDELQQSAAITQYLERIHLQQSIDPAGELE